MKWIALLSFSACVGASPVVAPLSGDRVTVFVPGYQGSFLDRESDRERVWITPGAALSNAEISLALPFEGESGVRHYGVLEPGGPVTRMIIVPALFDVQLYQPWLEFGADRLPGFLPWGYDWRNDIRDSARQLCAALAALPPKTRIDLIGHSMGGLVTLTCLRHASPELLARVDHVVFAGTPFHGAPGIYDDLQRGTPIGFNKTLLDSQALLTFASTWELTGPEADFFIGENGAPVTVAAFDADAWVKQGWGPFSNADVYGNPACRAQLQRMLDARTQFWAEFSTPIEDPKWKTMAVVGTGHEAKLKHRVRSDGSFDFDHPLRADGDGSVLTQSATPPPWLHHLRLETTESHVTLLNDTGVQEQIAAFLKR